MRLAAAVVLGVLVGCGGGGAAAEDGGVDGAAGPRLIEPKGRFAALTSDDHVVYWRESGVFARSLTGADTEVEIGASRVFELYPPQAASHHHVLLETPQGLATWSADTGLVNVFAG